MRQTSIMRAMAPIVAFTLGAVAGCAGTDRKRTAHQETNRLKNAKRKPSIQFAAT